MGLGVILSPLRILEMTRAGFWRNRTVVEMLDAAVATVPDKVAIVDWNSTDRQGTTVSFRQLHRLSLRIAAGLAKLGVEKGDVISIQLPNWWQFIALHLAAVRIGAITNPLMPTFRERELEHMLGLAESKVLVVPRRFRGCDYPSMVAGIRERLPSLKSVLVVGGDDPDSFSAFIGRRWEEEVDTEELFAARRQGPNEVTQILYTSGTTGEAKGVMHTANTLFGALEPFVGNIQLTSQDVVLMGSPLAHQTGFLYGTLMPIRLQAKVVLQDIWNAEVAAQLIQDEGCTFTCSATPFLMDLASLPESKRRNISKLRTFACGGAPIPGALVARAAEQLGARVVSLWGMTENGAPTMTRIDDPLDRVSGSDGRAVPGAEVRLTDADGRECPRGVAGNLQMRGAGLFVGYLKRPQLYSVDEDGWFDTGDLARMNDDGYIRISGRSKDVIIRGGENVPVVEVEGLLYRHPAIAEVAVVGMPDVRLGERGCAFVVLKPGFETMTLQDISSFLSEQKMMKQYHPERLEVVKELPHTPSGKIQKYKLRDAIKTMEATNNGH